MPRTRDFYATTEEYDTKSVKRDARSVLRRSFLCAITSEIYIISARKVVIVLYELILMRIHVTRTNDTLFLRKYSETARK